MLTTRPVKVYLPMMAAGIAAYFFMDPEVQRFFYNSYSLVPAIAVVIGARFNGAEKGWYGIAGFLLCWSAGDLAWAVLADSSGAVPNPSIADAFYFLGYPLLIGGIFSIYRHGSGIATRIDNALDSFIISIGIFVVGWTVSISGSIEKLSVAGQVVSVAYPAADIFVLGLTLGLVASFRRRVVSEGILVAALALLVFADSGYGFMASAGSYRIGLGLDAMWLSVYALMGAAALHPSMADMGRGERELAQGHLSNRRVLGIGLVAAVPAFTLLTTLRTGGLHVAVIAALVVVGGGLLVLRLGRAIRSLGSLYLEHEQVANELSFRVAEQEQAREALLASEQLFRSSFEDAGAGMTIVDMDGTFQRANVVFAEMLDYEVSEIPGMRWADFKFPEDVSSSNRIWAELLREDTIGPSERRYRRKDGTEVWGLVTSRIVRNSNGQPVYALAQTIDITSQRRADLELDSLRRQHELLLESVGDGIVGVDLEGRVTFMNPAAETMLGWRHFEVIGKNAHRTFHHSTPDGNLYPASECPMANAAQAGYEGSIADEVLWTKEGKQLPIEFVAQDIREGDEVSGRVITFRDVGERLKLEQQLLQSQKMEAIGHLAGGVAHDFNNLIFAIRASADFISEEVGRDHPVSPDVEEIKSSANRAADLVSQLLTFSRRDVVRSRVFDVARTVADMNHLLRRTLREDIALHISEAVEGAIVKMDPSHLQQIVMNLVVNGRDAMPLGGAIHISTSVVELPPSDGSGAPDLRGSFVRLTVSDTGAGMSEETKTQIFDPFFTTKERGRGTGLGLSTVYGIVEQAGGAITVDAELGRGTTFCVFLPTATETPPPVEKDVERAPGGGAGQRILVVEDELPVRRAIERILKRGGYEVVSATSMEEALELQATVETAVVLTDVVMPGGSGRDLIERLRETNKDLKSIYMSGYTDQIIAEQGVLEEGENFLQKPFSKDELLEKVSAVLAHG